MTFLNSPLILLGVIDFVIQWIVFGLSAVWKTEKYYDLTGSLTFIGLTYLSCHWYPRHSLRQKIQSGMVLAWAVRLGTYLFVRIMKTGGDRRFNDAKEKPALFFVYWNLQGIWVFVTLLPTLMLLLKAEDTPLNNRDYIGFGLWIVGFFFEVVADFQKAAFRNDPLNKDKFISTGLWSMSRHPNYFGEILLWFGLYLSASSVFRGKELLAVLCPVFDMLLITKVSGIPPLEKYGLIKFGQNPKYHNYLRCTAVLIPYIW